MTLTYHFSELSHRATPISPTCKADEKNVLFILSGRMTHLKTGGWGHRGVVL